MAHMSVLLMLGLSRLLDSDRQPRQVSGCNKVQPEHLEMGHLESDVDALYVFSRLQLQPRHLGVGHLQSDEYGEDVRVALGLMLE